MRTRRVGTAILIFLSFSIISCDALKDSEDDGGSYQNKVSDLVAGIGDRSVVLTWTDPDDADLESVEIGGDGFATVSVAKGVKTATIPDLINGTAYTFTVKTVASSGAKSSGTVIHAVPFGDVADLNAYSGNNQATLVYAGPKASGFSGVEISGTGINSFEVKTDNAEWGETVITGLRNGVSATFTVKVTDAYGNRQASGASVTLVPGMALNYTGIASVLVGNTMAVSAAVEGIAVTPAWQSADPSVATVDAAGTVTGVSAGLTRITATAGSFTASCGIAVMSQSGSTVTFTTTPGNPDPVFGYSQATGMTVSSGINLPVSVTCAKSSGSQESYFGVEVRESVATDPVRYRFEIKPSGMYRIRCKVASRTPVVLVPWTSSAAISKGFASNVLQVSQPSAGNLRFAVNGTTLQTLSQPYGIDFIAGNNTDVQIRAAVAASYNLDYAVVGKETVSFTY